MARSLAVHLHGKLVGYLFQNDSGRLSFDYDLTYISRPEHPPVSLAMPLTQPNYDHDVCHAVFGGMLPEGDVRSLLAKALGVSERNDFSLLAEIGGECAGAVSLVEPGKGKEAKAAKPGRKLKDVDLVLLFRKLPTQPLLTGEGVRLSLAGAQNKLALAGKPGDWSLPTEQVPSTHILKIAPDGYDGIIANELYCMRLAAKLGIPVAKAQLLQVANVSSLCVERFDRFQSGDRKDRRLHQEDFCQALGIPSENKYQAEGGPSLAGGVKLIRAHSTRPAADLSAYLKLIYFNFLSGNADAHGKNFSLLWLPDGPALAPAYDLVSTAIYTNLSDKMAMKIGSEYDPERVAPRHWESFAKDADLKPGYVLDGLAELAKQLNAEAPALIPVLEAEVGPQSVFAKVLGLIQKRCAKLI